MMDLWVVAAAAGAGYLAQHLQNVPTREKERPVESSSTISTQSSTKSRDVLMQFREIMDPFRRLVQEAEHLEFSSEQKRVSDQTAAMDEFGGDPPVLVFERASTTGKESFLVDVEFMDTSSPSSCRFSKNRLIKRRSHRVLSNIEKVEEYLHGSVAALRLKLANDDRNQAIERSHHNSFNLWPNAEKHALKRISSCDSLWSNLKEETSRVRSYCDSHDLWSDNGEATSRRNGFCNEKYACFSASSINNMDYVEFREHATSSQERMTGGALHSSGQPNEKLLFFMGLMIGGLIPAVSANKTEAQKLNEKLKEALTLVQDLQEELDMKQNLTVKLLEDNDDNSQPWSTKTPSLFNQNGNLSGPETEMANYEKAEMMSRIEAELEAELLRLELNIDLERRTSDFLEDGRAYESESEEESDVATGIVENVENYAVCPHELSIRLYEVIESRLQERIQELETALLIDQNWLPFPDSGGNGDES